MVLDTETAPTIKYHDSNIHPETMLVYDIGWIVASGDTGAILERRSFVVAETFYSEYMESAYYADKLPQYYEGLGTDWTADNFINIWQQFKNDVIEYNIKNIWAYNAKFDEIVLNNTIKTYSNGFVKWFKPYKCNIRDIWDYASCITKTKKYVTWCVLNGYVSDKGNPSTSAEVVHRYLTDDNDFIEAHTALADCEIENAILTAAKRRHVKTRHSKGQGWRDAAATKKEMDKGTL